MATFSQRDWDLIAQQIKNDSSPAGLLDLPKRFREPKAAAPEKRVEKLEKSRHFSERSVFDLFVELVLNGAIRVDEIC